MHIVKCRICQQPMDLDTMKVEEWTKPAINQYYHTECYRDYAKKINTALSKNAGPALEMTVDEDVWYNAIYFYFNNDLKAPRSFSLFVPQWKQYLKQGLTPKGIYFTLRYCYDIKGMDLRKSNGGIGIVPYMYKEATTYWAERFRRNDVVCKQIEEQVQKMYAEKREIRFQKRNDKPKRAAFSLEQLEDMDE